MKKSILESNQFLEWLTIVMLHYLLPYGLRGNYAIFSLFLGQADHLLHGMVLAVHRGVTLERTKMQSVDAAKDSGVPIAEVFAKEA